MGHGVGGPCAGADPHNQGQGCISTAVCACVVSFPPLTFPMHLIHGLLKEISVAVNSMGFGAKPVRLASPSTEYLPKWEETRAAARL